MAVARMLTSEQGAEALDAAAQEKQPDSLAAATRLRKRFPVDLAAAALTQELLRRKAALKFGDRARTMLFTRDGLEQATRSDVAQYRAQQMVTAGATDVVDLGCGIGADSLAFAAAGLKVTAVEKDPATAIFAAHNLDSIAQVMCADAECVPIPADAAVYLDPARRDDHGRVWTIEAITPSWYFVQTMLRRPIAAVKVGPGIAHSVLPKHVLAEWISHHGDVVEATLWAGRGVGLAAVQLPTEDRLCGDAHNQLSPGLIQDFLYDIDGAALRAKALPTLAHLAGAHLVAEGIGYLTGPTHCVSPWLTAFAVHEVLRYDEAELRRYTNAHQIGTLEIKKRGVDLDPAVLRRRLKLRGSNSATMIITPTIDGVRAIIATRLASVAGRKIPC